jgi:hypothetical protein
MRLIALALAASVLATAPAHAAWKTYTYKDLGVQKDFPSEPKMEKGLYTTPLVKNAPMTTFTVDKDGNVFKLMIVDLQTRAADGANILGEALADDVKGRGVTFTVDDFPLYDKGFNSVYGMVLRVQKPDGGRTSVVNFFNKGRLYKIQVTVPPTSENKNSPDFARFLETVVFHLQGYGFDFNTGHDYPIGDDDPNDRDNRVLPNYKPPPGYETAGKVPAADVVAPPAPPSK